MLRQNAEFKAQASCWRSSREHAAAMRAHPLGAAAAIIGEVRAAPAAMVFLRTDIGGTRVLDMLVGDPLPRIC